MSDLRIRTNNVPRLLMYGHELTEKERAEFDYMTAEELDDASFFRYKGRTFSTAQFLWVSSSSPLKGWSGYHEDGFFCGTLIKYPCGDQDHVLVGNYCS